MVRVQIDTAGQNPESENCAGPCRARVALFFPALTLLAACAFAQVDWPAIRGPGNNAQVEELQLALPWPPGGPPVIWKKAIGQGYSGGAIVDGRIYTQAQDRNNQFVLCLDLDSGATIWKTRYAPPWDADRDWPGPYGTPTVINGRVYFTGCYGTVGCLDADDGGVIWKVDAGSRFEGKGYGFGYSASPLVEDGRLFLPIGGEKASVIALDAASGDLLWATGSDPAGYTPCYPITVDGQRQIVSSLQNVLVAHEPATGAELWRHKLRLGYNPHPSWPLWEAPHLFVSLAFRRGARCLRLTRADGVPAVEKLWESDALSNDLFSGVVLDGLVYGFDIHDPQTDSGGRTKGELKCLDLISGEERWSTAAVGGASVLTNGRHLIIFEENGTLIVAEATPAAYREIARSKILPGEVSWTNPSVYGQRLLVRGSLHMACVFLGNPRDMPAVAEAAASVSFISAWSQKHHDESFWSPSLADFVMWFAACIALVFIPAALAAAPVRRASGKQAPTAFFMTGMTLSAVIPALAGEFTHRLVFTWPAGLFLLFVLLLIAGVHASRTSGRAAALGARALMVVFCFLCLAYFLVCQQLHLLVGWGYLIGFLPAWPAAVALAKALTEQTRPRDIASRASLAFTVYFWASALAYEIKAYF